MAGIQETSKIWKRETLIAAVVGNVALHVAGDYMRKSGGDLGKITEIVSR